MTVHRPLAMTIYRAVIETVGDDHQTLAWIVSPTVSGMMAQVVWRLNWQPTQWDQRQQSVPMVTGVWPTTLTVRGVVGLRR